MGDRALVAFYNSDPVHGRHSETPAVYLHWHGESVPEWVRELAAMMGERRGDPSYAVARFCGIAHSHIDPPLSLGLLDLPAAWASRTDGEKAKLSHGDAGFVAVDASDFSWIAYGGYLTNDKEHWLTSGKRAPDDGHA